MRKELLQLFYWSFCLFYTFSSIAQSKYSFADFDYPEESVSWGSQSRTTYFIPVDANRLLQKNRLELEFKTSEALDPNNSFVTILINDLPYSTKPTGTDNSIVHFSLPFSPNQISSGFLKIDVISDFAISDELCETYNEGAFWIRRLSSSHIIIDYKPTIKKDSRNISQFVSETKSIFLPKNPPLHLIQYATYIQFYLKKELELDLEVKYFTDSTLQNLDKGIILGTRKDIPAVFQKNIPNLDENIGWIQIQSLSNTDQSKDSIKTEALIVTGANKKGFEKAAQSLLDKDILKSAFTSSYRVEQGKNVHRKYPPREREINFKNLGVQEEITEGVGKLFKEIALSRSAFMSNPSALELQLDIVYRPLKKAENAYLNIYMDDVLKYSKRLDESGRFSELISFEDIQFRRNTNAKIEYYYIPAGGFCVENPTTFYAQIDLNRSFFRTSGIQSGKNLSFLQFPENFMEKESAIYLDLPFQQQQINSLSELINLFNPELKNTNYWYPKVLPMDSLKTNQGKYNPIIISSKQESLNQFVVQHPYLDLSEGKYNYKKDDFKKYFKLDYTDKIGVNQLFRSDDIKGMYLYVPDGNVKILSQLIKQIHHSEISNTGDIILASPNSSYFFNLNNIANTSTDKEIQSDFDLFWEKYRVFAIFGLLILMIVLLIYIFQKSQESKKNIVDDK